MTTKRITPPALRGFMVPAPWWSFDKLDLSVTDAPTADLTAEGGPNLASNSDALSLLIPEITSGNTQRKTILLKTQKAGYPDGSADACRIAWRESDASDGDSAYRGWNPPNFIELFETAFYKNGGTKITAFNAVCLHDNQNLLVAAICATGTIINVFEITSQQWSYSIDPAAPDITVVGSGSAAPGVCQLPSGRVLVTVQSAARTDVYFSDDNGATWALYAENVLPVLPAASGDWNYARMYNNINNDIGYFTTSYNTGTHVFHLYAFASADLGAHFTQVLDWDYTADLLSHVDVLVSTTGKVLVFGAINGGTTYPVVYIFDSIWNMSNNPAPIAVDATATINVDRVSAYQDENGTIFVVANGKLAAGTSFKFYMWSSEDDGETWTAFDHGLVSSGDASRSAQKFIVVNAFGGGCMLHNSDSAGDHCFIYALGGWSTFETEQDFSSTLTTIENKKISAGPTALTVGTLRNWFPYDLPENFAGQWTHTGATTGSLATNKGFDTIATVAQQDYVSVSTGTDINAIVVFDIRCSSGSTSSNKVGLKIDLTDNAAKRSTVSLRFDNGSMVVYDEVAASSLHTVNSPNGAWRVGVNLSGIGGRIIELYQYQSVLGYFKLVYAGTLANAAPAATGSIKWGNGIDGNCTATSLWKQVQVATGINASSAYNYHMWRSEGSGELVHVYGRRLSGADVPFFGGSDLTSTSDWFFTKAIQGPARYGEVFTFEPGAFQGPANVFPDVPSPNALWIGGPSSVDCVFEYMGAFPEFIGSSIPALYIANANFKTAYLEKTDNAGASWETVCKWDATTNFGTLHFSRSGNQITVDTGVSQTAGRFIHYNELVGDTIELQDGTLLLVTTNTSGAWTNATTANPILTVTPPNGASDFTGVLTSGTLNIWKRTGIAYQFAHPDTHDGWRVRLASGAGTYTGKWQAGAIQVGFMVIFGRQWSDGYSKTSVPVATVTELPAGTEIVKANGAFPRREWTIAWPEGIPKFGLTTANPQPNYMTDFVTLAPVVARNDVDSMLFGLLEQLRSGETPIVVVEGVNDQQYQANGYTQNDPMKMLYGHIVSPVRVEQSSGYSDAVPISHAFTRPEFVHVSNITIRELV